MTKKVKTSQFSPGDRVSYLHYERGEIDGRPVIYDKRKRYTATVASSRMDVHGEWIKITPDDSSAPHVTPSVDGSCDELHVPQHGAKKIVK